MEVTLAMFGTMQALRDGEKADTSPERNPSGSSFFRISEANSCVHKHYAGSLLDSSEGFCPLLVMTNFVQV